MTGADDSLARFEPARFQASGATRLPYAEWPTWIACGGDRMLGVMCTPVGRPASEQGVLIAVGGPQYRVGSHRQFVLLARELAQAGYVSLRFDVRGMGDSEGATRTFEGIGEDLGAAIDALHALPGVKSVTIWALCDGASAALMFGGAHPCVNGLILLNPWVRSESTLATTRLKHYYGQRLLEREFWSSVIRQQFDWHASLDGLVRNLRRAVRRSKAEGVDAFQARMADGWRRFGGRILLVLSGRDLTAKEFLQHAAADRRWRGLLARSGVCRIELPDADHTFSSMPSHARLVDHTIRWLRSLAAGITASETGSPSEVTADERFSRPERVG